MSKSGNLITEKRAIGILTDCMIKIQKQMANLSAEDTAKLENVTGLLWTRKMDKDNYIEPQESKSLEYDVNRAASYIIVNQLLFYHLLQYHQPEKYQKPLKPISNIEDPALFKEYFNDIQQSSGEGDYKAVFGIDLLSILPKTKNMVEAINQVIELIVSSEIEQVNQDILGKIFHNMIPKEIRKRIAAYYTSNSAGQLLARFSIDKPESIVMDLTCGSGTLLVEAYHVKDKLYQEKFQELTPEKRHNQILKGLFGNDISVFAARLASINLTRQNLGVFTEAVNITVGDGLSIRPFENPDLANNKTKKKYHTYTLHGKDLWIEYPYADCILMNPPFSSKRGMSKATVAHINKKMAEYDLEKYVDGNMGLNAYFILHADQFLKEGGTMSMVISSATFNTIYARKILDFLKDKKYIIEYVFETLADKPVFSEDCDFKEYMIVLKKTKLGVSDSDVSKLISFSTDFTIDEVPSIYNAIKENKPHEKIAKVRDIETRALFNSDKWSELFINFEPSIDLVLNSNLLENCTQNTSSITVNNGYNGTYSDFLILPNKHWTITKINEEFFELQEIGNEAPNQRRGRRCEIPAKYLIKTLRKLELSNAYIVKPEHYVLSLPTKLDQDLDSFKDIYLDWAFGEIQIKWDKKKKDGHKRTELVRNPKSSSNSKTPWYNHAHKNKCYNKIGTLFTTNSKYRLKNRVSLGVYSTEETSASHVFNIIQTPDNQFYASWMASSFYLLTLFKNQREIAKGLYIMVIEDFSYIKFPVYKAISNSAKIDVIEKWKKLSDRVDREGSEQSFLVHQFAKNSKVNVWLERIELDKAWLQALKFPDNEITQILNKIHRWISDYFEEI